MTCGASYGLYKPPSELQQRDIPRRPNPNVTQPTTAATNGAHCTKWCLGCCCDVTRGATSLPDHSEPCTGTSTSTKNFCHDAQPLGQCMHGDKALCISGNKMSLAAAAANRLCAASRMLRAGPADDRQQICHVINTDIFRCHCCYCCPVLPLLLLLLRTPSPVSCPCPASYPWLRSPWQQ